jgi:hypothetical protein
MNKSRQERFDSLKMMADLHGSDGDKELERDALAAMNEIRLSANLAAFIVRLAIALKRRDPGNELAEKATKFLSDNELLNVLR